MDIININEFDKRGKTILDLGCGDGRLSKEIKNAKYIGVDYATNKFVKKDLSSELKFKADLILILGLFEDETNPLARIKNLKFKKLIFTLHNANSVRFRITRFVKSFVLGTDFAYTSFTANFLKKYIKKSKVIESGPTIFVILTK